MPSTAEVTSCGLIEGRKDRSHSNPINMKLGFRVEGLGWRASRKGSACLLVAGSSPQVLRLPAWHSLTSIYIFYLHMHSHVYLHVHVNFSVHLYLPLHLHLYLHLYLHMYLHLYFHLYFH